MDSASFEGRRQGRQKLNATLTAMERARRDLVCRVQVTFLRLLLAGSPRKAEDVRRAIQLPEGCDPRVVGVAVLRLSRVGLIEPAGWLESDQPQSHQCPKRRWQITDRVAAELWLATHDRRPAGEQLVLFAEAG